MQRRPTEKWAAVISQRKVYVYLDTTRGLHHRYGVKDVRRRGASHRVWHARKRRVRRCSDAAVEKRSATALSFFAHVRAISSRGQIDEICFLPLSPRGGVGSVSIHGLSAVILLT